MFGEGHGFYVIVLIPFFLQALAIMIDEIHFHHKRGLPKWERIGHPLDTLSLLVCLLVVLWIPFDEYALGVYIGLATFSCFLITKDEFVHTEHCSGSENWLHAFLFVLHPITLIATGFIWPITQGKETWLAVWLDNPMVLYGFLNVQASIVALFFLYQLIFWNFIWKSL